MALHTRPEHSAMSEINVTPLVDVMLVLLVVFIVTAPLLMQAVPLKLPSTAGVAPIEDARSVQVSIDADEALFIDRRRILPEALETELTLQLQQHPDVGVLLHVDENVRYGRVAQVMAGIQRAGIDRVSFVMREE